MTINSDKSICELLNDLAALFSSSEYMLEINTSEIYIATLKLKFEEIENDSDFVKAICSICINDNTYSIEDKLAINHLILCVEDSLIQGTSPNNTISFENCINDIVAKSITKAFDSKYVPLSALFKNAIYAIYDNNIPLVVASTINTNKLRYGIELVQFIGQEALPPNFLLDSEFFILDAKSRIGTLHSEIHDKILDLQNFTVYSYSPLYPNRLFELTMEQEKINTIKLNTDLNILNTLKNNCKNPQKAILELTNYKRQQKNINLADLID